MPSNFQAYVVHRLREADDLAERLIAHSKQYPAIAIDLGAAAAALQALRAAVLVGSLDLEPVIIGVDTP